jgi:UDP-N-acetylmuramyl pentapeptide phosphotransferase/UDP-N-acetylglucosamine-1-phosphate transferase
MFWDFGYSFPTMPPFVPVRPEISLAALLVYAFFAFALGLVLTPWFISFLRRNRLGKQLRVDTVDGREASIFRKYHEKKFGTPTMGGILIWGSIVLTVLLSRAFAYFGFVENSLLQRGQVYVPLWVLLTFGIVGAIDDYLNVIGSSEEQWKRFLPRVRMFFWIASVVLAVSLVIVVPGMMESGDLPAWIAQPAAAIPLYLASLAYLGSGIAVLDNVSKKWNPKQSRKGGLAVFPKLLSFIVIALVAALWFYYKLGYDSVAIPFWGTLEIGWWYVPLAVFVIVGSCNAVNVTDGLDGLVGGLLVIAFASFGVLSFLSGLSVLAAFCAVIAGAIAVLHGRYGLAASRWGPCCYRIDDGSGVAFAAYRVHFCHRNALCDHSAHKQAATRRQESVPRRAYPSSL